MREIDYILYRCEKIWDRDIIGICPYGQWGKRAEQILTEKGKTVICYDNYVGGVQHIDYMKNSTNVGVLFCCDNESVYNEILLEVKRYIDEDSIVELFPRFRCGRHSYGPITVDNGTVESIGNFCSFAINSEVVANHDVYISSHEFLSYPGDWENHPGYVPGVVVKHPRFIKKTIIGNDVWIGKNATIIAGCNIGNGVIVGANSVVTHSVPDYAIVVGNPGMIIKYRYNEEQIKALNQIAWWNWTDERIKENLNTFYYDVEQFISIHSRKDGKNGTM